MASSNLDVIESNTFSLFSRNFINIRLKISNVLLIEICQNPCQNIPSTFILPRWKKPTCPWARESGSKNIVERHGYGKHGRKQREARQFQDDEELLELIHSLQKSNHHNEDLIL